MKRLILVFSISFLIIVSGASVYAMGRKPFKPAKPYCQTTYPIILVPGVVGFDSLFGFVDYYYGVANALTRDGAIVYTAALTAWAGTDQRGQQLIKFIDDLKINNPGYTKFNVIAHSHGATTSRYAMHYRPEAFASLTSIAGPHQGTPFADYAIEKIQDPLKTAAFTGIELLVGELVALLSGHPEFIGTQDLNACVEHFTMDGIEKFNADFPCAGVPKGSSRGSYGDDAYSVNGAFSGNGKGEPNGGIRYYSWTGNIKKRSITSLDILDSAMVFTNLFVRGYDYKGDADAFIPVSSSHFGKVLCDTYYWNHIDEINHTLGIINPFAANPVSVFRQHANRLQKLNL